MVSPFSSVVVSAVSSVVVSPFSSVVVSEVISSLVTSSLEVAFWEDVSSGATAIPLVVISSVLNPGKTNNSFPSSIIPLCSKINGILSTSPSTPHSNVIDNPSIFIIVNIILIKLGYTKGISIFWPSTKLLLSSPKLAIISKVPSFSILSKLKSSISTTGGT